MNIELVCSSWWLWHNSQTWRVR